MLVDLHVHTALSACAENIMSPRRVLEQAAEAGVKVLALTDHNASRHVAVAMRLADEFGLTVFPAMEVTSREDVHLLAFFADEDSLDCFQALIDEHLPDLDGFTAGDQVIYDEQDEIVAVDTSPRQFGVALGISQLVDEIHRLNGRVVPSHIYRPRFSLTSQLGMVPSEGKFDAVELSWREWQRGNWSVGKRCGEYPVLTASDAHILNDVGVHSMDFPGKIASFEQFFGNL